MIFEHTPYDWFQLDSWKILALVLLALLVVCFSLMRFFHKKWEVSLYLTDDEDTDTSTPKSFEAMKTEIFKTTDKEQSYYDKTTLFKTLSITLGITLAFTIFMGAAIAPFNHHATEITSSVVENVKKVYGIDITFVEAQTLSKETMSWEGVTLLREDLENDDRKDYMKFGSLELFTDKSEILNITLVRVHDDYKLIYTNGEKASTQIVEVEKVTN